MASLKGLEGFAPSELGAVRLRNTYAVRPYGACGTHGWREGRPWQVFYSRRVPAGVRVEP